MRFIFTGSRDWNNPWFIEHKLKEIRRLFGTDAEIVHGAHRKGLDHMVHCLGKRLGFDPEPHPADWNRYGKGAGPIRNAEMVDLGADCCLGFKDGFDLTLSRGGTENCIDLALRAGIPCEVYRSTGDTYDLSEVPSWYGRQTNRR